MHCYNNNYDNSKLLTGNCKFNEIYNFTLYLVFNIYNVHENQKTTFIPSISAKFPFNFRQIFIQKSYEKTTFNIYIIQIY